MLRDVDKKKIEDEVSQLLIGGPSAFCPHTQCELLEEALQPIEVVGLIDDVFDEVFEDRGLDGEVFEEEEWDEV